MKTKNIFTGLMVLTALFAQPALAQGSQTEPTEKVDMNTGLVVWTGSTIDEVIVEERDLDTERTKYFFLVQFKPTLDRNNKELYMGARGDYGVQGILSTVGMRMQLVASPADHTPISLNGQPEGPSYQLVSRISNPNTDPEPWVGDRMGFDQNGENGTGSIYLDRSNHYNLYHNEANNGNNFPNWKLIPDDTTVKTGVRYKGDPIGTSRTVQVTTYYLQNMETQYRYDNWNYNGNYKPTYVTVNNEGRLVSTFTESEATRWIIVSEQDFEDAMAAVTWGEVDLGVFVQDASFGRDNKDGIYWVWKNAQEENGKTLDEIVLTGREHWHQRNQDIMINGVMLQNGISRSTVGTNVAGTGNPDPVDHNYCRQNFAQYYSAEIYNEENSLTQMLQGSKIPNLIDGLYKVTAQALYWDGGRGTTNNGVAYFIVQRDELKSDGTTETTVEKMPIKPLMEDSRGQYITPKSGVSAGYEFNNHADAYLLTTYVEINGNVNLTIGIEQNSDVGWTVIGNVHFYAHGKQALMIDEDWGEEVTMSYKEGDVWKENQTGNPYEMAKWYDNYDYPSTVYYQRTFKVPGWNTICMPMDLTGRQVRQAFGEDAMVCEFLGQRDADPNGCILFSRPPDLDMDRNMDAVVIHAGKPYIIYVTNQPQRIPNEGEGDDKYIEVEVGNGQYNHTVRIDGKCYLIPGVFKDQYVTLYHEEEGEGKYHLLPPIDVTSTDSRYASDLHFVGSFYHKVIPSSQIHGSGNASGTRDLWVITKGNMYHLTGSNDWNVWATYAYLYRPVENGGNTTPAKNLTFAIDDGQGIREITTSIEGLFVVSEGNNVEDHEVYNLSGIKVGKGTLDTLPKGIYILNGKKYVKR